MGSATGGRAPHRRAGAEDFTGRFDNSAGSDILFLDDTRYGRIFSNASPNTTTVQNTYPY